MAAQVIYQPACRGVPHLDCEVVAARREEAAYGAVSDGRNVRCMTVLNETLGLLFRRLCPAGIAAA